MTIQLQHILDLIRQSEQLSTADKAALEKAVKEADKAFEITNFKLDRTEKVKRTTAVLLEETIAELEQKRKAVETQNRELEIEAALERVRARTMAMRNSKELNEVIEIFYLELKKLESELDRCFIMTFDPATQDSIWWMASGDGLTYQSGLKVQYHEQAPYLAFVKGWQDQIAKWRFILEGKEKKEWDSFIFSKTELSQLPEVAKRNMMDALSAYWSCSFQPFGSVSTGSHQPLSDDAFNLLIRFSKVFDLTYTCFLDLQKAEAQAREAQIEVALERVRSRAMAMHSSQELKEVAYEVRIQLGALGQKDLETCAIHLYDESPEYFLSWAALRSPRNQGEILQVQAKFPRQGAKIIDEALKNYYSPNEDYVIPVESYMLQEWIDVLTQYSPEALQVVADSIPETPIAHTRAFWLCSDFAGGSLVAAVLSEPSSSSKSLLRRFANVFGLAFKRFTDLKQAEAQAREAQIEAALERVRAQSMAMHQSHELSQVASLLYQQLLSLGISQFITCGFNIYYEKQGNQKCWITQSDGSLLEGFDLPLDADTVFKERHLAWKRKEPILVQQITGKVLRHHIGLAIDESDSKRANEMAAKFPDPLIFYNANFAQGYLSVIAGVPLSTESQSTLVRFAKVFEQTYTRFLDLQKAEAQAREAHIEAALERVRSRSLAMHKSDELEGAGCDLQC